MLLNYLDRPIYFNTMFQTKWNMNVTIRIIANEK